jgi:aminoacyl tRNA synthase complex-interacting multifunctional protein 1
MTPSLDKTTLALLKSSKRAESVSSSTDIPSLSKALFPQVKYTPTDEAEISKWVADLATSSATETSIVATLNTHLSTRTTILGAKPSVADLAAYAHLAPLVRSWDDETRTGKEGFHHVVRFADYVQNADHVYGLELPAEEKVAVDPDSVKYVIPPVDAKAEKEKKKKEKEAAAAAAGTAAGAVGAGAAATALTQGSVGPVDAAKEGIKGKVQEEGKEGEGTEAAQNTSGTGKVVITSVD